MKTVFCAVLCVAASGAHAQAPDTANAAVQVPVAPGPVVFLWPNGAPGSEGQTAPEKAVAPGQVANIHRPSIAVFLPAADKVSGVSVLVVPGGGHRLLAIEHEGYNVGAWLSDHGIAAFVLKHRLAREQGSPYKIEVESLQDAERAMRVVRSRSSEWRIEPGRVGVMGFSAGGELAALIGMRGGEGAPDAPDRIDSLSSRPAFQALIYPGNSKAIIPTKDSPPAFLVCGYNDRTDISEGLAEVYLRFKRAGASAELHVYSESGHGFGLRTNTPPPTGDWPQRFREWLGARGLVRPGS